MYSQITDDYSFINFFNLQTRSSFYHYDVTFFLSSIFNFLKHSFFFKNEFTIFNNEQSLFRYKFRSNYLFYFSNLISSDSIKFSVDNTSNSLFVDGDLSNASFNIFQDNNVNYSLNLLKQTR
jgi:hypothetical protein